MYLEPNSSAISAAASVTAPPRVCGLVPSGEIGEEVVVVAGTPPGIPGSTNSLRVHRVGDAKNGVVPAYAQ